MMRSHTLKSSIALLVWVGSTKFLFLQSFRSFV